MYYVFSYNRYEYDEKGQRVDNIRPRLHTLHKNIETEPEAQQLVRDYDASRKSGQTGRLAGYDHQKR